MGKNFVHTQRGREQAASDDGNAHQIQNALNGSVFTGFSVQDGEGGV